MNDFDLKLIRDYLWTNCRGFPFRAPARIACERLGFDRRSFHDACHRLMMGLGVPVVGEDAGEKKGVFIATCRADMELYVARMDKRINGELARRNRAQELMDRYWPEGKPPAPDAPQPCFGVPPIHDQGLPNVPSRARRRRGPRTAPEPVKFYSYVCETCGAECSRAVRPEAAPTCREATGNGEICMGRLKLLTAEIAEHAEAER